MKKLLLLCVVCVLSCLTFAEPITLEHRLELLVDTLEAKRVEYHIPGMALAVVLDDKIIFEHSFGLSNIEDDIAVTSDTIFSIGSVTKSFTSAAVGVLVDDGKMRWDAPITEYLPWFELPIDTSGDDSVHSSVLMSDLLSHQTGFTRMHFLAVNNSLSSEEVLRAAVLAEPWEEFRSEFLYNNVQFLASGFAAGEVAGSDWNTLVEERLLAPIGMRQTYTSRLRVPKDGALSMGYQWDEEKETFDVYPLRTIDNIGPAGSIVSTAGDMARWIRFQLGGGVIDGKQILSEEQQREMWAEQFEIAPGAHYGFGWMLIPLDGVVEHGGNVRGGCAQVAMFPEENLGFVLLMNVSASPLQGESISLVKDTLLGEIGDANKIDYTPYIGNYIANFGPFRDATFAVQEKDGELAIDVPDQMLYELKHPNEDGKWYFALTNQIAISFDTNEQDEITGLRMYQAGLTFDVPREGVEIAPEISLDTLQQYLGNYFNEEKNVKPSVLIQNNRLSVDVPGQMVFELHPPNDEGIWVGRVTDKVRLRFVKDDDSAVTGFEFLEGEETVTFVRVAATSSKPKRTAQNILDAFDFQSREEALANLGTCSFEGTGYIKQSGLHGTVSMLVDPAGRIRAESEYGDYGWFRFWIMYGEGEMDISFIDPEELNATEVKNMQAGSPLAWAGNWPAECTSMSLFGEEEFEGIPVWTLRLEYGDDPAKSVAIDQLTGDVLVVRSKNAVPEIGGFLPYKLVYRDYKEIEGVRIPMSMTEQNEMTGASESIFNSIETGLQVSDNAFILEPRERPIPWVAGTQKQ